MLSFYTMALLFSLLNLHSSLHAWVAPHNCIEAIQGLEEKEDKIYADNVKQLLLIPPSNAHMQKNDYISQMRHQT